MAYDPINMLINSKLFTPVYTKALQILARINGFVARKCKSGDCSFPSCHEVTSALLKEQLNPYHKIGMMKLIM